MKERLDKTLVRRGLADNIKQASALILSGIVYSENKRLDKVGLQISDNETIFVKDKKGHKWVSRGGLKLAHALEYFKIDVRDFTALDIGASTGGFTDVLLDNGAKKVYAVDVGYGELAWKLQQDDRVVVLDRTNARNLTEEIIPDKADIIVCDASFVKLSSVLPVPLLFAKKGTILVALIKPQFEVAKYQVGEGGIITNPELHQKVCDDVELWLNNLEGWSVKAITESPIKGMEGNKEFLIYASFM